MTGWNLFFVLLGVISFSSYLCRFLCWVDNPRSR